MHDFCEQFTARFFIANLRKVVTDILNISKKDAHKLHEMGVPFGEGGISHTHTSHKKYYLCESRNNMKLLRKIEKKNLGKRND